MNRFLTAAITFGAGMFAYNMMQNQEMLSRRKMKKMQRRITRAIS